jgi:hypothetical protein
VETMKSTAIFTLAIVLILCALPVGSFCMYPSLAETERQQYFPETGRWVRDEFLDYYQSHGGLQTFGYPISERYTDQGIEIQYFQKARLEWHPHNPDPYKVQLGLLGVELGFQQPAVNAPLSSTRDKVYFPETGHTLAYVFLDYFKANGGINTFGYPISEMYFEGRYIVQYCQRLKMIWDPDDATSPVQIGHLGELYLADHKDCLPPEALVTAGARIQTTVPALSASVTAIHTIVALRYSVLSQNYAQTITVLVTDNNGQPRPDAQVSLTFFEESVNHTVLGNKDVLTDVQGYAQLSLPFDEWDRGTEVTVRANAKYGALTTTAQNMFLLW